MSKIDLHIHSDISIDGEHSPEKIVKACMDLEMVMIAVTDHNSVRGIGEALKAASGIQVLTGIELDCMYKGRNFHLLGYGIDYADERYATVEQDILEQEQKAAKAKIRLFVKTTGIPVAEEEIMAASVNGIVTGEQIAEHVLEREDAGEYEILRPYLAGGEKSDMPNVNIYWDFFAEGKPAYVPIQYLQMRNAVKLIHDTGGIAVLAHPGQNPAKDDILYDIINENIDGIEVFSSYHSERDVQYYLEAAEKNRLLVTCGSDYHGKHKPKIALGGHGAVWNDDRLTAGIRERLERKGI